MDQDTTRKKGAMVDILQSFGKTRGAILIGTQMVAKGIDFPDVAVVGVLNADIGLTMPDFRAEERIFQLLTQVAGRAGRSHVAGNVVVQTFNAHSVPVQCAVGQKFMPFYKTELEKRRGFSYPPFSRLILIVVSSDDDIKAENRSAIIASELERIFYHTKMQVMGPVRAPLERAKTMYRYHIIVKTGSIRKALPTIAKLIDDDKDIRIQVIPDPIDMM